MNRAFMGEAARLALEAVEKGLGGPFGAVIVRDGAVVGRGCNRVLEARDPTAHAEILAVRGASRALDAWHLSRCEIYTTCEPCPMCLGALHWARVERIHYALSREDAARIGFADADIAAAMTRPVIPRVQVPCRAASDAFRLWSESPDLPRY